MSRRSVLLSNDDTIWKRKVDGYSRYSNGFATVLAGEVGETCSITSKTLEARGLIPLLMRNSRGCVKT